MDQNQDIRSQQDTPPIARRILARAGQSRRLLSPWSQRYVEATTAGQPAPQTRRTGITTPRIQLFLKRVEGSRRRSTAWHPNVGSLRPGMTDPFTSAIATRFAYRPIGIKQPGQPRQEYQPVDSPDLLLAGSYGEAEPAPAQTPSVRLPSFARPQQPTEPETPVQTSHQESNVPELVSRLLRSERGQVIPPAPKAKKKTRPRPPLLPPKSRLFTRVQEGTAHEPPPESQPPTEPSSITPPVSEAIESAQTPVDQPSPAAGDEPESVGAEQPGAETRLFRQVDPLSTPDIPDIPPAGLPPVGPFPGKQTRPRITPDPGPLASPPTEPRPTITPDPRPAEPAPTLRHLIIPDSPVPPDSSPAVEPIGPDTQTAPATVEAPPVEPTPAEPPPVPAPAEPPGVEPVGPSAPDSVAKESGPPLIQPATKSETSPQPPDQPVTKLPLPPIQPAPPAKLAKPASVQPASEPPLAEPPPVSGDEPETGSPPAPDAPAATEKAAAVEPPVLPPLEHKLLSRPAMPLVRPLRPRPKPEPTAPPLAQRRLISRGWRFKTDPTTRPARPERVSQATARLEGTQSSGKPLADKPRSAMEGVFRRDFRDVRIHRIDLKPLNVQAATRGRDIFVDEGQDDNFERPESMALLGHELTHVSQSGLAQTKPASDTTVLSPTRQPSEVEADEAEAETTERSVMQMARSMADTSVFAPVQRAPAEQKEAFDSPFTPDSSFIEGYYERGQEVRSQYEAAAETGPTGAGGPPGDEVFGELQGQFEELLDEKLNQMLEAMGIEGGESEPEETAAPEATNNLDTLARQVLPYVRRMIAVERERRS